MQLRYATRHTAKPPKVALRSWRHLVVVLALVLQSFAPVSGLAHEGGTLIEICGEFGVSEIRVDADGNKIPSGTSPCPDCGDCAFCMITDTIGLSPETAPAVPFGWALSMDRGEGQSFARNPAQFWADNRGPPSRTEKATDLAMKLFVGPTRLEGRVPWI